MNTNMNNNKINQKDKFEQGSEESNNITGLVENNSQNTKLNICKALKEISWISFPTSLFYLGMFMQQTINLAFIGHTYEKENKTNALEGIGISHLYVNCSLLSIVLGIVSGLETLGSNAYGAKKYHLLGLYYHRSQLIAFTMVTILLVLQFFFATDIIAFFGIKQEVLYFVDKYIKVMMFFVFFDVQFGVNFRYLNIVNKSHVNLMIVIGCLLLHPLWCYIFINLLELGVVGAGISLIISQMLSSVSGLLYIHIAKPLPESIFGYRKDSFRGWWDYLKVAIPSAMLMCAEWWGFEICSIIAIWIGSLDYTVHILLSSLYLVIYSACIGFGVSASIIIGRSIVHDNIDVVKQYSKIILIYALIVISCILIILMLFRNYVLYLFIDQEDVIEKGKEIILILGLVNLFDLMQTVLSSICRGLGKQLIASLIVFINFYITQNAMAIFFGKVLEWGVKGIWFGSFISCIICTLSYSLVIYFFDLKKIQTECIKRIEEDSKNLFEKDADLVRTSLLSNGEF